MSNDLDDPLEPQQTLSAPGILTMLWRRKAYLVFGLVVGLGVGYLDYLRRERVYQSTAQLFVQKRRIDPVQQPGPVGGLGSDSRMAYVEDFLATQEALIKSHVVLSRAADFLANAPLESSPPGGDLVSFIATGLTISRVETGRGASANILNISFRGPSSRDCEHVVNAVIAAYEASLLSGLAGATKSDLEQIERSKESISKQIEEADKAYGAAHDVVSKHSPLALSDLKTRINLNEVKKQEMDIQIQEIELRLSQAEKSLKENEPPRAIIAYLLRSSKVRDEKPAETAVREDPAAALRLELELLLETGLGKDHPQVVSLQRRIDRLTNNRVEVPKGATDLEQLSAIMKSLKDEVAILKEQSSHIETKILKKDRETAERLEQLLVVETQAADKRDRLRKRYNDLDEREKQIIATEKASLFESRVINPAGPGGKISPVLLQCLMIAMALGLVGGGGLAYLAELTDKSFRTPEEIRRRLGLSVVGHIPSLLNPKELEGLPSPLESRVVVHHRPKSTEAEAYRGVRTALYFSTQGKGHQVIQVTSPNPGDGKSTLSANLAVAIAQSGKRVVLIDCDFRKPRIHKIFGANPEFGLASVIAGDCSLSRAIQQSEVPGLSLLPCGPRPANPAELLTGQRFQELLDEIKKQFDFVLIDTPPLLAVSDPAVVAPRVDGVLLTIRITNKVRPAAERAKETLMALGANVVGVVVNDLHGPKKGMYGYGYGYGYSYGYGYRYSYNYTYGYADHYGDSTEDSGVLLKVTDRPLAKEDPPFAEPA